MKKFAIFLCVISIATTFLISNSMKASAVEFETLIDSKTGRVFKDTVSKVELYGTYQNKGLYAEKIRIEVKDIKTGKTVLKIQPKTDSGYQPRILLENFENGDTEQIFMGMSSGGSGGYGYFYVYDLKSGKEKTVFDYQKWDMNYSARYVDNYKVEVKSLNDNHTYLIDLSNRETESLNKIYNTDGTVKNGVTQPDVSAINYVFPYFNSVDGKFQLQVFQRITGQYNADLLGYVVNQLKYDGIKFTPFYSYVGIL